MTGPQDRGLPSSTRSPGTLADFLFGEGVTDDEGENNRDLTLSDIADGNAPPGARDAMLVGCMDELGRLKP